MTQKDDSCGQQYWAIKTTEGGPGNRDHWEDFKREQVIAVGWDIRKDPAEFGSHQEYLECLERNNYDWDIRTAARTIYKFAHDWQKGDLAIICIGYPPNQVKDVYLYGLAKVGDYFFDQYSWWSFKRKAKIWPIERHIPLTIFVEALGGSMWGTINGPFSKVQFQKFSSGIKSLYPGLWPYQTETKDDATLDDFVPRGALLDRIDQLNTAMSKESAKRVRTIVARTVRRDTQLVKALKELCEFRCQFPGCGVKIPKRDGGFYIEVAHIQPVSEGGQSAIGNLLVLCPNHHKEFDYGELEVIEQTASKIRGKLNGKEFEIRLPGSNAGIQSK
jgi:hypothetical protein